MAGLYMKELVLRRAGDRILVVTPANLRPQWVRELSERFQLGVSVREALVRLRAYAFGSDRLLADVAEAVVAPRLRLDDRPAGASPGPSGS